MKRQRLHPLDDGFEVLAGATEAVGECGELGEGQRAEPFAGLVIPQPDATADETGADEERGGQAEALQDGRGNGAVVARAVIEGERDPVGDVRLAVAQGLHQLRERDHPEVLLQILQLRRESLGRAAWHADGMEGDDAGDGELLGARERQAGGVSKAVQDRSEGGAEGHEFRLSGGTTSARRSAPLTRAACARGSKSKRRWCPGSWRRSTPPCGR